MGLIRLKIGSAMSLIMVEKSDKHVVTSSWLDDSDILLSKMFNLSFVESNCKEFTKCALNSGFQAYLPVTFLSHSGRASLLH